MCKYCKKEGASLVCEICNSTFHNWCGFKNNCSSKFADEFPSYCHEHVLEESSPPTQESTKCSICYNEMEGDYNPVSWIKSKCCQEGYIHLICMRKAALSAGYYLRCLFCGEKSFREAIKSQNVYVPDREASWENNSYFIDIYRKAKRCDHRNCICPKGRNFESKSGNWVIHLCSKCSMKGLHKGCMGKIKTDFVCKICSNIYEQNTQISFQDSVFSLPQSQELLQDEQKKDEYEPTSEELEGAMPLLLERKKKDEEQDGPDPEEHLTEEERAKLEKIFNEKLKKLARLNRIKSLLNI